MAKLFLLRHIKSQWNEENRFTGWMDVPLDENEIYEAKVLADKIFKRHKIDKIYCSTLFRNMDTIARMFEFGNEKYPVFMHIDKGRMKKWGHFIDISQQDVPVYVTEKLNERYYGKLQGANKDWAVRKYGKDKVKLWRRSFDIPPPKGESLKDVLKRVSPFFKSYVQDDLRAGKNVLVVASHNALRAIAKQIEGISDKKIINFEIAYGGVLEYDIDKSLKVKSKDIY
ncbi:histidine phosphatase family protein [Patescibacteria group bacterium]|nr:histidine phosphatase family protein [Patescibacteria group bacterium]